MVERMTVNSTRAVQIRDDADMCHQAMPPVRTDQHLLFPAEYLDCGMMQVDEAGMVAIALAKGSGGLQLVLTPEGARHFVAAIERAIDKAEAHNTQQAQAMLQATLNQRKD